MEQYYKTGVIKTVNSSKLNADDQSTYRLEILCKAKTPATVSLHFENNEMTAATYKSMLLKCKGTKQTGIRRRKIGFIYEGNHKFSADDKM